MVFDVVLFEPEIPPNTGNIIRLCANTGAALHLVEPLGFELNDRALKRAGLDYHEYARVQVHVDLAHCLDALDGGPVFMFSTRGARNLSDAHFTPGAALVFGPETRGLPNAVLAGVDESHRISLPMVPGNRSLNLSNAVAVAVYEAWRQCGYAGAMARRGATQ